MLRVRYQRQPSEHTCGQTVMAMLLGVSVIAVVAQLGSRRTHARHFVQYLRPRGLHVADRLLRVARGDLLPRTAILRVLWRGRARDGHWVLWHGGRVYDPLLPSSSPHRDLASIVARGGRVTSFLRVEERGHG